MNQSVNLISKKVIKHLTNKLDKRAYYAFLLDNIGPFPEEISQQLPPKVFDTIWQSFYHYLSLVSETAYPGGGKKFIEYVEDNTNNQSLSNLSHITDCLVFDTLANCQNKISLDFWLNISSLLEYGFLYNDLSPTEQQQTERFEYLQELDHFSEIMDLSLLTKHLLHEFHSLSVTEKKQFMEQYKTLFNKYLGLDTALTSNEDTYKPIAGRSKHINLGLERMLGEASAKRKNCHYQLYTAKHNLGEFSVKYYPIRSSALAEAKYKVLDPASIGEVRTNYPYISLLLTSNSPEALSQAKLKELSGICSSLIMRYGLEMGLAMFDGYIFDNHYTKYYLSLVIGQIFKENEYSPIQLKLMSIGCGAILIYQNKKIEHISVSGTEELNSYLGHTGSRHKREIITLDNNLPIKIVLAPYSYGLALQTISPSDAVHLANQNAHNPLAWLMTTFIKPFTIPITARNILLSNIKPNELEIIERPKWISEQIKQIPEFNFLTQRCKDYLQYYQTLEVNILYAHLHADRIVDIHQEISIDVARTLKNEALESNIGFTLQPLIDNLHVRDVFDYKKYNDLLVQKELEPDVILTEDSLLIDRIGQGILDCFVSQNAQDNYQIVYEGNRALNVLFPDNTIVQLIDHMDKEGRLSCVTFDLAQIYYRQAPELFEQLFREDILLNYSESILARWFQQFPDKNYHQIIYDQVYTNSDIQQRNKLFQTIKQEVRPDIHNISCTKFMRHYIDKLKVELIERERSCAKKVISLYILEGSYDAQFDRYAKVHAAFALPDIDTYRITFTSEELGFNVMCIKS
ncbi:hypothetical protein [Legionella yabuuchiae]|uniref:hypothetical protein n=1 Tax=Legionella yabuuchiae TaxID=376727 RepID=UPI001054A277|nr:hypothetical protein [Legionella yabuuchiae]